MTVPAGKNPQSRDSRIRRLNLGSGRQPAADAVNLDISARARPDVVHDLNVVPWPFDESTFDEILGYDVLEHVKDVVTFMQEVHRVAAPDAVVRLTVPHFSSANSWRDPTHVRAFAHDSLDYFVEGHPLSFYGDARFQRLAARLTFHPSLVNRVIQRLAARWPTKYEDRWAWIFPAWFIYFELKVLKSPTAHANPGR